MWQARTNARDTFSRWIFLFLFSCVIGWLYEVVLAFVYGYGFINRGFLFGPYLPLYGFGACLLMVCLLRVRRRRIRIGKIPVTPVVVFLLAVLLTTALEYAVGLLLEVIFHQRFWDYSTYDYQLHGRICLSASLRFGVGGMLFLYVLEPLFTAVMNRIPQRWRFALAVAVAALLLADLLLTLYWSSAHGFNPELAQPR